MSEILPSAGNVIYEVNLEADAAIEGPFDTWLRDHIADLLQLPGFLSAEVLADAAPREGRVRRTVQYRLKDQAALDDYLANHAPRMRAAGVALFGDRYTAERRVLAHREEFIRGKVSTENCLNCGEVLTGQHCAHCGQRARVRVLSLWGMTRDLLDDVLDWDARIWRTLRPLAFKPGKLTQDYLRGRRASYTPPFRMYFLLSVAFFVVATAGENPGSSLHFNLDEKGGASLTIEPDDAKGGAQAPPSASGSQPRAAPASPTLTLPAAPPLPPAPGTSGSAKASGKAAAAAPTRTLDAETLRLVDSLVNRVDEKEREKVRQELRDRLATMPAADFAKMKQMMADPCSSKDIHFDLGPYGKQYEPKLRQACSKIWADTPSYGKALFQNIPKMMFIFLPLIAVVMYVLYIGSGRYYVEHLLFVVHFHAFFFLGGLAFLLIERLQWLAPGTAFADGVKAVAGFFMVAFLVYVPVYLFVAMRRVYGQGRFVTFLKYSTLGVAYLFCLVFTAVGLLFYTALTL
ncbi:MAG TPA: DUF4286 family protein [Steroidobacteraceae bacterium]|nr:DUF4286 family protein [Steroidobacteraceae bacterium]